MPTSQGIGNATHLVPPAPLGKRPLKLAGKENAMPNWPNHEIALSWEVHPLQMRQAMRVVVSKVHLLNCAHMAVPHTCTVF